MERETKGRREKGKEEVLGLGNLLSCTIMEASTRPMFAGR